MNEYRLGAGSPVVRAAMIVPEASSVFHRPLGTEGDGFENICN